MLRNTFFAVLTVLAAAAPSQAAIMLEGNDTGTPIGTSGLVSYMITAVGTAGEMIDTFSNPRINAMDGGMGVHNVGQAFTNAGTPTKAEHAPGLWNASWSPYDTHFLFDATQTLSVGGAYTETNNGATTGMLGLERLPGQPTDPSSGFGEYNFTTTAASKGLTPTSGQADSSVPFMQVVMRAEDAAMLSIRVVGDGGGSVGDFTGANAIQIGGGAPPGLMAADANLGDTANAFISHLFTATGGTTPYTWSNLILNTPTAPGIAPTLTPEGQFTWNTGNSPRNINYSWTATVTDASNPALTDTATLQLFLVIPEPATMTMVGLAMVGLVGFARRRS